MRIGLNEGIGRAEKQGGYFVFHCQIDLSQCATMMKIADLKVNREKYIK